MTSIISQLNAGSATTDEALQIFDSLDAVDVDFMIGNWTGEGFRSNHPMDGLLEAYHWHGKRFESSEDVHPLVFKALAGGLAIVNPVFMGPILWLMLRNLIPKSASLGSLTKLALPLFSTSRSCARLRILEFRGKSSATMIYDKLPINDVFRKIDESSVLGIMDLKGMKQPFFFILRREDAVKSLAAKIQPKSSAHETRVRQRAE